MIVPQAWQIWLMENYVSGVAPEDCKVFWQKAGLTGFDALWAQLEIDPWVQGARTHWSRLRKCQSVLAAMAKLRGPIRLTRLRKMPLPDRLMRDFVQNQMPVRFPRDLHADPDWWLQLSVEKGTRVRCYSHPNDLDTEWDLFLSGILKGATASIRAHNKLLAQPGFTALKDPIPRSPFEGFNQPTFWIQPKGDFTAFHFDTATQLWTVLAGAKRVWFVAPYDTERLYPEGHFSPIDPRHPNFKRYPKYKANSVVVTDVKPGCWLMVPSGVWHAVETREPTLMLTYSLEQQA